MNSQVDVEQIRMALVGTESVSTGLSLGDQQAEAGAAAFAVRASQSLEQPQRVAAEAFRVNWLSECPYCGREAFDQTASPFGGAWRTIGLCYACGIRWEGVSNSREDVRRLGLRGYSGLWCR